jgi:hypothetical protein
VSAKREKRLPTLFAPYGAFAGKMRGYQPDEGAFLWLILKSKIFCERYANAFTPRKKQPLPLLVTAAQMEFGLRAKTARRQQRVLCRVLILI